MIFSYSQARTFKPQNYLYRVFPIQPSTRTMLNQVEIILNYILTYLIFLFVILQVLGKSIFNDNSQFFSQNTANTIILALFLIRLAMVFLYIIIQKNIFLTLGKTAILISLIVHFACFEVKGSVLLQTMIIVLEISMFGIWAYKGQNRIQHFDSRLFSMYPFLKQAVLYSMTLSLKLVEKQHLAQYKNLENAFSRYEIHVGVIIMIGQGFFFLIDRGDFIYNKKLKYALIYLDFVLLTDFILFIYGAYYKDQQVGYATVSFMTIVFLILGCLLASKNLNSFSNLFEIQTEDLYKQNQTTKLNYFYNLKQLISDKQYRDEKQYVFDLNCFIKFHMEKCLTPTCPFNARFKEKNEISLVEKQNLIQEFLIKQLSIRAIKKTSLTKLLIFILSPKNKVFKYLNKETPYMERQYKRLISSPKDIDNELMIIEGKNSMEQTQEKIKFYLQNAKVFYKSLLQQDQNCDYIVKNGFKMINTLDQIQKIKQNPERLTQDVRILLNNFSSRIMKQKTKILQNVISPAFLIQSTVESGPLMLISAQPENFLQILDVNTSCCKHFYLSKEEFLTLKAIDLQPQQIRENHIIHFKKTSQNILFNGEKQFTTNFFVKNKLGFTVLFTIFIYLLNSIKGRMWCVILQISHHLDSIIIIGDYLINNQEKVKLIGITELCSSHGFQLQHKGLILKKQLVQRLKEKALNNQYNGVVVQAYDPLFQNSSFEFNVEKKLKIIQKTSAFGFTYYLISIKNHEDSMKRKTSLITNKLTQKHFNDTLINGQKKQSEYIQQNISIYQKNNIKPNFQFFYHTDGKIRNYPQKQKQILSTFHKDEQRKKTKIYNKLNEDIVQMRLYGNNLDFVQNMQKQQQFQMKPKTQNDKITDIENTFSISPEVYQQSYVIRKNTSPKWLKIFRFVSIVLVLLILILASFLIYRSFSRNNQNIDQMNILNNLDTILQNYLSMTNYVLGQKHYKNQVYNSSYIPNKLIENQNLYKQLFIIFPSTQTVISQSQYDSLIQDYLININNFTIYALSNKTNLFKENFLIQNTTAFDVMFDDIYSNAMNAFQADQTFFLNQNLIASIFLIGIIIVIFIGTIFLVKFLHQKEIQIQEIFLKLKDIIYRKELKKIRLFQQYFYFNKDLFSDQDLLQYSSIKQNSEQKNILQNNMNLKSFVGQKKNAIINKNQSFQEKNVSNLQEHNQQEDNPYLKIMYKPISRKLLIFLIGIWGIIEIFLLINQIIQVKSFQQFNMDMKNRKQELNQISDDTIMAWLQLNKFPQNQKSIRQFLSNIDQHWNNFRVITLEYSNKAFSHQYLQFYVQFWSSDLCLYLNNSVCDFSYNRMLNQGMGQVVVYIFRKLNFLASHSYNSTYFRQLPSPVQISDLIAKYLSKNIEMNINYFSPQFENISNSNNSSIRINYYLFLGFFLFLGIVFWVFNKSHQQLMKMQRMLSLLQFQQVKKNRTFKKYFKKNCYNAIYK